MKRTTIVADEALLLEIKQLAAEENKTVSDVIADALRAHVKARLEGARRTISFIGVGRSEHTDVSERAEEILASDPHRHGDE